MTALNGKILDFEDLCDIRHKFCYKKIVFTNGCFDILHVGHVRCLKAAAAMGDVLVIGLNSDISVKRLKGDSRPVNSQSDRAEMLSEYPFVDYIVVFDEDTPEKIVRMLRPDIWVKGGDCNPENSPAIELALADELGIKRVYTSYVTGKSTTRILQRSEQAKNSLKYKVAVIGDCALDLSYFTHASEELSAETLQNVNYVDAVSADAGGAGNLASDLVALGDTEVDIYGFCGADFYADVLKSCLRNNGVNCNYLLPCRETSTYVYHKFYNDKFEELPRYDIGPMNRYTQADVQRLLAFIKKNILSYDMIIINQQLSASIYSDSLISEMKKILENVKVPVWLDTRVAPMFTGCSYKINAKEVCVFTGIKDIKQCAAYIYNQYMQCGNKENYVVITNGENGALAYDGIDYYEVEGIESTWPIDTCGAGDAFLAALCHTMLEKNDFYESLRYANAAGAACTKFLYKCGHPTLKDVVEILSKYI